MPEEFRDSVGLMLSKSEANSAVREFTLEPRLRFQR